MNTIVLILVGMLVGAACLLKREQDAHVGTETRLRRVEEEYQACLLKYFEDSTDPRFERAPDWTPENGQALASFLSTEHGQALSRRFAAVAAATAIAGCSDAMHTAHSAGNGNGWNEAYEWFCKLSRVTGEQVTNRASGSGDNSERPDNDEEALLERFSS